MRKLVACVIVLSVVTACNGGAGGGATPEGVFARHMKASDSKDWKTVYLSYDPEKSKELLSLVLFLLEFDIRGKPEARTERDLVLKKHGMKDKLEESNDRSACFADLMVLMDKYGNGNAFSRMTAELAGAKLKDVKVEGDKATAKAVRPDGEATDARFVRRNNRWYLAVDLP